MHKNCLSLMFVFLAMPHIFSSLKTGELLTAIKQTDFEAVQHVIKQGADINAIESDGDPALVLAVKSGNLHIVQLLIEKSGLDVNARRKNTRTALIETVATDNKIAMEKKVKILKILLQHQEIDINAQNLNTGNTALIGAAIAGSPDLTKLLLAKPGINLDIKNKRGQTALSIAKEKNSEIFELLKKYIMDKNSEILGDERKKHHDERCWILNKNIVIPAAIGTAVAGSFIAYKNKDKIPDCTWLMFKRFRDDYAYAKEKISNGAVILKNKTKQYYNDFMRSDKSTKIICLSAVTAAAWYLRSYYSKTNSSINQNDVDLLLNQTRAQLEIRLLSSLTKVQLVAITEGHPGILYTISQRQNQKKDAYIFDPHIKIEMFNLDSMFKVSNYKSRTAYYDNFELMRRQFFSVLTPEQKKLLTIMIAKSKS